MKIAVIPELVFDQEGSISSPEKPSATAIVLCVTGSGVGLAPETSIDQKDFRKVQDVKKDGSLIIANSGKSYDPLMVCSRRRIKNTWIKPSYIMES